MVKNTLIIFVFIFLLIQNIYACEKNCPKKSKRNKRNSNGDQLIFVNTLCRHGDRNINGPYPTDPYTSAKYWPEGFAELTNIGKKQQYKLGQYFAKRYESLLGNGAYDVSKVYVRSTDVDRVLMSAEANLAGLFPPSDGQVWNKNLDWQPVPVHTQPLADDILYLGQKQCDRYNYVLLQYMNTSAYTDIFVRYAPLISYLEKNAGQKITKILDIFILFDTLTIEQLKFKRLPDWAERIMQPGGDFEMLAITVYYLYVVEPELKRLKSGFLLKDILDRLTSKAQGTLSPDRTLWMNFVHDVTITNLLNTLGLFKPLVPPYASCLLFELYQGNNGPYIQLFYKKKLTPAKLSPLNIPNCGTKCPLANWYQLYADYLPTQSYAVECALEDGETLPPGVTSVTP